MKTDNDFRLINHMKAFILTLDSFLVNYPKKEKVLKDKISETSYDILELMYLANTVQENKYLQMQLVSKFHMLDFYLEKSYKSGYINEKLCQRKSNQLNVMTRMLYGWIKSERENKS